MGENVMKKKEFWEYIRRFPVSKCEKCQNIIYGNDVFAAVIFCSCPPARISCPKCRHTNSSGELRTYDRINHRPMDFGFSKPIDYWWTKRTPFWAL